MTVSHSAFPLSNQFDKHSPCHLTRLWLGSGEKAICRPLPWRSLGCICLSLVLPTPLYILTSPAPLAQELQGLLLKAKKRIHILITPWSTCSFCAPGFSLGFQFQQQKCWHLPGAANAPWCPRAPRPCCPTVLSPGRPGPEPAV